MKPSHLLMAVLGLATGCQVHEYVATRDGVPFFATSSLERVVDRVPLGHHERILEEEERDPALRVEYNGRTGYVRKDDVSELTYVHPVVDGGTNKEDRVGRAVRSAIVSVEGKTWPASVQEAICEGRVDAGMNHEQVEVSWGWPTSIEPLEVPGGERWVYRRHGWGSLDPRHRRFSPHFQSHARRTGGDGYAEFPVVEARYVEFSDGLVVRSYIRYYYDADSLTPDGE
jgi:hypothetical protein